MQSYRSRPTGHREKHLNTLVAMICGLVGGQHAHLSTIADHAPSYGARQESVIKRFKRFVQHDAHTLDGWFLPVARELLSRLAAQPLEMVMDGSVVGRGCIALMARVVYHRRALPLCWVVVQGSKGHLPQPTHQALLAQLLEIIPAEASVTFWGDGAFDGTELQGDLRRATWQDVCRTAANILSTACGMEWYVSDRHPKRGQLLALTPAWMTAAQYDPISLLALWEERYAQPIYFVTNIDDRDAAVERSKLRAHSETFFSDQKGRGFHLHKSHRSDPKRLCRLLIAACLVYLWLVYLGVCALSDDWMRLFHRQDRCDLSLFRLGLRLLARCLQDHIPIPDGLVLPASLPASPIRTFLKQAT